MSELSPEDRDMAAAVRDQAEHWRLNEHPPPWHVDWDDDDNEEDK